MKARSSHANAPKSPATPAVPVSEPDRLWRGLPLESGEAQPRPAAPRLH
jgi:hypothetical protein